MKIKTITKILGGLSILALSFPLFAAVNINTADADSLQNELKGIGSQKAEAIIAYREANGSFKTADELANVKGIGMKTVEKNRENILVEDQK